MADCITLNKNQAGILLMRQIVNNRPMENLVGIISINDINSKPADGVRHFIALPEMKDRVLEFHFDDQDEIKSSKANLDERCPKKEHVQKIINFGKEYMNESGRVVVHCHAGQSRSTAATYILYLMKYGPGKERHAWDRMVECSQSNYHPNMTMLKIAQELLPEYNLFDIAIKHHNNITKI